MTPEERRYLNAREALASERDIGKAVYRVADRNCSEEEARAMLEEIYRTNKAENRKTAWMRAVPGGLGFIAFWVIFAVSGRFFLFILGGSLLSFIWGIATWIAASGYEVDLGDGED